MLSHYEIWKGIDLLAKQAGISKSALAKQAGLDPTALNLSRRITSKNKKRWPSTETLAKLLTVTKTNLIEFAQLIREKPPVSPRLLDPVFLVNYKPKIVKRETDFLEIMEKHSFNRPGLNFSGLEKYDLSHIFYILTLSKQSANMLHNEGSHILISVFAPIKSGNLIVFKTRQKQTPSYQIAKIIQKNAYSLVLNILNKKIIQKKIPHKDILWISRILWVSH